MLFYIIAAFIQKRYIDKNLRSYFLKFITYKIFSTIIFVVIHLYYYKGGDTFLYFDLGVFFSDQFVSDPYNYLQLIINDYENYRNISVSDASKYNLFYLQTPDALLMGKFLSPFCLIGGNYFLTVTLLFSIFCSAGQWLIFKVFSTLYPSLKLYFAWGTLFFPTISIWSSGILKDPLTLLGMGLILHSFLYFSQRKKIFSSIILVFIGSYLCLKLKPYILYTFIPIMFLWLYSLINKSINKNIIHLFLRPLILISFIIGGYLVINQISKDAGKYSLENLLVTTKGFQSWHTYLSETQNQSGYSLGEFEYTPLGVLAKVPEAIFTTFFRPFLYLDTHNASTTFEGVQAFILLGITLFVLFKVGLRKFIITSIRNQHVRVFILFALVFGFAVGFTSFNFGALSRYKIPALPFFTASLAIIYFKRKK